MTLSQPRKYVFSWDLLGDIAEGRPNLGQNARLEVYRLMQFCLRDVLEEELDAERTDRIFYRAGYLAGRHFYEKLISPVPDFAGFINKLHDVLLELGVGVLRMEEEDPENGRFVLTVSEDLDCSGLPELAEEICTYDEGFIAALLKSYTGEEYRVTEVDCWCTGDRTCRFLAIAESRNHT